MPDDWTAFELTAVLRFTELILNEGEGLVLSLAPSIDGLRKRGIKAVETFARKGKPDNPSGPMEFYLRAGFRIHKEDEEFPLMRIDL